ncbi:hypothetical protein [Sphingomonas sp. CARO-RG-8B-R24-01]|uniref:hypothetical protein n=1 Tax=Sphingomonas sp. CARO-RG-8B-R24-01 TaxID=2914831 RepID=UPI001F5600FC|nr:hypothetical protein [Sphingomonas sp. CARO-RG-8B-R24-01]
MQNVSANDFMTGSAKRAINGAMPQARDQAAPAARLPAPDRAEGAPAAPEALPAPARPAP